MAKKLAAIRKYRPEIKRERTRQMPQVVEGIAMRTGLNKGEILLVIYELQDAILDAHRSGQAVKVEGLGTFTPTIRMDGKLDIVFRPEPDMLRQLNDPTKFHAKILNKPNIGKSADDLAAQWNAEHPDDPVEE
ncbi:MAG: HU family DNA-binding protein [Chloroflexi bacterium]|nr:HU family DNA-binding protein [Chloroflexota bacterium]